jgi:hypothetical protein
MTIQIAPLNKHTGLEAAFMMMKTVIKDASKRLSFVFWLISLHTFFVGLALIFHPPGILRMLGFHSIGEEFFPVQGGVFHILMGIFYLTVVLRVEGFRAVIYLSIITKSMAFVFLLYYYFFGEGIFIVLFSGIVDGALAVVIILAYQSYNRQALKIDKREQMNDEFWYY